METDLGKRVGLLSLSGARGLAVSVNDADGDHDNVHDVVGVTSDSGASRFAFGHTWT